MGHSSCENTAGISLLPSGTRTDNWTGPFCHHGQSTACIEAYSFARRLWLAQGMCTEEYVGGCKSLLESTPSNELSLGARPLGDCGPHGFALHQEAREWEEEVGPDLPTLSAMQAASRLHQRLPKSPHCPCPWRPLVWQCRSYTAIAAGQCTGRRAAWQLPFALPGASCAPWDGVGKQPHTTSLCRLWPLQPYTCAGSCCPRERCFCFADRHFHTTCVTLPCL